METLHLHAPSRIHACPPGRLESLAETVGKWFAPEEEVSLSSEYPLLFRDHPAVRHYIVEEEEGSPLSHAALLVRHVVSGPARLRIGMISCVATAPEARGRGLASEVVDWAVRSAADKRCALVLLWSELEEFYGRLGFHRMGREWIYLLERDAFAGAYPEPIPYSEEYAGQVYSLYLKKAVRVERSPEEMRALLSIPGTTTYLARGSSGGIEAYACQGKGRDFQGVIHECGGEPRAMERLFGGILARSAGPVPLILSPLEESLGALLAGKGIFPTEGALGLGKILDPGAVERFAGTLGPLADRFRAPGPLVPFHLPGLDSV